MLKISIPKPCHEDWGTMTPSQQGRHCNTCAKTVIDFTAMNDEEVQSYFIKRKNENICGRLRGDQLSRITIILPHYIFEAKIAWWKKFLAACLLAFSTMLFSCETKVNKGIIKAGTKKTVAIKKDNISYSPGYVGGLTFRWDSTVVNNCSATTGVPMTTIIDSAGEFSIIDSSFKKDSSIEFMGDTILFQSPEITQTNDSGTINKHDSSDCSNNDFINL